MASCPSCQAEVAPGTRWCSLCHANTVAPEVGKLAAPGARFIGYLLDLAIPAFAFFMIAMGMFGSAGSESAIGVIISFGLLIGYIFWAFKLFANGTTPGKRMLSLRVVKESGQAAGFGTMLFREWIGKWISGMILSLGFLWILFDKDNQGWHDKFASTYVVKEARMPAMAAQRSAAV